MAQNTFLQDSDTDEPVPTRKRSAPSLAQNSSSSAATKRGRLAQPVPARNHADARSSRSDADDDGDDDRSDDAVLPEFRSGYDQDRVVPLAECPIPKPSFDGAYMWFQTTQVNHMWTILSCLRALLSVAEIKFTETGIRMNAVDNTHVCMVSLHITNDTLEEGIYECNHNYCVAVDIDEWAKRLKMGKGDEYMTMSLDGPDPDSLDIKFALRQRMGRMPLSLNTPLDDRFNIPPLVYRNQVDMLSAEFKEAIGHFKSDSDIQRVTFIKTRSVFTISVRTLKGPIEYSWGAQERDTIRFRDTDDNETTLRATFILSKVINATKVTKATKWVNINMPEPPSDGASNGLPLKISYTLAALGDISFYVAPTVDDDDEPPPAATAAPVTTTAN